MAVTLGDEYDFYVAADNNTVTFTRVSMPASGAALLPTNFWPTAGGAKPQLLWVRSSSFPMAANPAESGLTGQTSAPHVIGRIV